MQKMPFCRIVQQVALQNMDICKPLIIVVMLLDSRLGKSPMKNYYKVQCRALLYANSVNYLGAMLLVP